MFRKRIVGLALVLALAAPAFLAACGDDNDETTVGPTQAATSGGGAPGNLTKVTVSDNKFTPVSLQVPIGATVTWEWTGSAPHSVKGTLNGESIQSPTLTGTGVFLQASQKATIFQYQCGVHGEAMKGTITWQ
jgi:plastocyanin